MKGLYETRDLSVGATVFALFTLTVTIGVAFLAIHHYLAPAIRDAPLGQEALRAIPLPPEPRLKINPGPGRIAREQIERRRLESYGWADESAGIVHIPIEEAMKQIANEPSANGRGRIPGDRQ